MPEVIPFRRRTHREVSDNHVYQVDDSESAE